MIGYVSDFGTMRFKFCEGYHTLREILATEDSPSSGATTRVLFDAPVEVLAHQHVEWETDGDWCPVKAWLVDSESGERVRELKFSVELMG